ncbi:DUF3618 domain-containing protein [Stutzerimonas tarimensis]|uniref:DUF3618 domain-containing protein n=1 Tax=Stutzerimonas tarimensis TaxID=1507735 RepID=A0ABV7T9E8_9GAMM
MSTRNQIEIESQKDPETLEREIDKQRADIGHIVDELENKLSPGELFDKALGYAKGNGGEFFGNLADTVKANPVPTLLTGIGLAWLMAGQNRDPHRTTTLTTSPGRSMSSSGISSSGPSMGDKLSQQGAAMKGKASHMEHEAADSMHQAADSMRDARDRASGALHDTSHRLSETGHHAADSLREGAMRARGGFDRLRHEQPLALGAIGVALGALIAASMPPTRREDQLLGERSDEMTDELRHKAEEQYERVSAKGEQVVEELKQEAHKVGEETRQMAHEKTSNGQAQHASGPH